MTHGFKNVVLNLIVHSTWNRPKRRNSAMLGAIVMSVIVTIYLASFQVTYLGASKQRREVIGRFWVHRMHGVGSVGNENATKWDMSFYNGTFTYSSFGDWVNPKLDILHTEQNHFLPNYKNPCWYEPLLQTDLYKDNKYMITSRAARLMSIKMIKEWSQRMASNTNRKRLRCLPYFMVIGQPKCGSTDLFHRIIRHPDVEHPPIKELHWWSRNRQGRNINFTDIIPLSQYIDMFDQAALKIEQSAETNADPEIPYHPKVTGEASVSVLWENDDWFHYPENRNQEEPLYINPNYVRHIIPDVKLIVVLRNPTDRLFSDYLYFTKENKSAAAFDGFVQQATRLYNNCTTEHSTRHCLYNKFLSLLTKVRLRLGMYEPFLRDWFKVFPREQILILRLEDYSSNIHSTMAKVYDFLNLRRIQKIAFDRIVNKPIVNKRRKKDNKVGPMLESTRETLNKFYYPYNQRLAALLNNNDFLWGAPPLGEGKKDKNDDADENDDEEEDEDEVDDPPQHQKEIQNKKVEKENKLKYRRKDEDDETDDVNIVRTPRRNLEEEFDNEQDTEQNAKQDDDKYYGGYDEEYKYVVPKK